MSSINGYSRGVIDQNPQLLFLQCTIGLVSLYCLDYYIGGERGISPSISQEAAAAEIVPNGSEIDHVSQFSHNSSSIVVENTNTAALSATNEKEDESLLHRAASNMSIYILALMIVLIFLLLMTCVKMAQKICHGIRSTSTFSRRREGNNALMDMFLAILSRRYGGPDAERRRVAQMRLMRREITPDDYEQLLWLDDGDGSMQVTMGVEQSMIDRCPAMRVTQSMIHKMTPNKGGNSKTGDSNHLGYNNNDNSSNDNSSRNGREDDYACTVCLEEYCEDDEIRTLPCMHQYHVMCIDPWLLDNGDCPMCKRRIDDTSDEQEITV